MDFEACVREVEMLAGQRVNVHVFGRERDAPSIAHLSGTLQRMGDLDPPLDLGGETATTFWVGDATLNLWPSRFVSAQPAVYDRGWIDIRTTDAFLRIGPWRPAWTD